MAYETITFEKDGPIGVLTLNLPKKLNAIDGKLEEEVNAALDVAENDDDVRVVLLTGAGRAFCAGFDLAYTAEEETDLGALQRDLAADMDFIMRFWHFPKPTISAVHPSPCLGDKSTRALDARASRLPQSPGCLVSTIACPSSSSEPYF